MICDTLTVSSLQISITGSSKLQAAWYATGARSENCAGAYVFGMRVKVSRRVSRGTTGWYIVRMSGSVN